MGATAFGLTGGHRVEQRELLTHEVSALTVDAGGGDVTVRGGGAAGTVEVIRRTRGSWGSIPTGGETWQGTTLALVRSCSTGCDVDFEIRVPDGVAVTAQTGSGDVELDGSLGAVSLYTGSGDLHANVTSSSITTRSGSGDTSLRLQSAPTVLAATTGSGDVDIRVPKSDAYAVDAQTGSGDRDVDVEQQGTSDHRIQVRTGSGDISVQSR